MGCRYLFLGPHVTSANGIGGHRGHGGIEGTIDAPMVPVGEGCVVKFSPSIYLVGLL